MGERHAPTGTSQEAGQYEIRVKGHLDARWAAWFDGMTLTHDGDGTTLIHGHVVDQAALAGLGILLAVGVLLLCRSRVDADASGVRVRNLLIHHDLPWQSVRAVRFERKSAWGSLALENGDEVSLLGLQAVDGEYAARAVEGLRALHAAARANDPVRPPLLYDS